jgi:hypothetical protein
VAKGRHATGVLARHPDCGSGVTQALAYNPDTNSVQRKKTLALAINLQ